MKLETRTITDVLTHWIAEFAPLSKPHLLFFLQQDPQSISSLFAPAYTARSPQEQLDWLWGTFVRTREIVYTYLAPFALAESAQGSVHLTTNWLQMAIRSTDPLSHLRSTPADFVPELPTMSLWKERGLIRGEWNRPESNSAAALLMMRAMLLKRRRWLPSQIAPEEPWFWVWSLGPHDSEPVPCPIPLEHPPRNRLLFSPWPLVGTLPGWKLIHKRGAYRWSNEISLNGKQLWDLSVDELRAWNIPLDLELEQLAQLQRPYGKLPALTTAEQQLLEREYLHPFAEKLLATVGNARLNTHLERYYMMDSPSPFSQHYT